MKKKILWLGLSFLLAAALVLAACGPAVPGEQEEEEEEVPEYGGTLTIFPDSADADPPTPDIFGGYYAPTQWLANIQEKPIGGDFEKYGPRGTGEYKFQLKSFIPAKYQKGVVLESWEISYEKLVWHIRPGIHWQGRDVMESRELTAADVVADLIYFTASPRGKAFRDYIADIYTTDRYTLVIDFTTFNAVVMYKLGYEDRALISPPETEGSDLWEDQVGTGPFMFKEYVVGSHMTFERNPDYWDTTTINGKEYEIPFVDELVVPIIPDESTQIAALRTGTIDFFWRPPPTYWQNLDQTAPELESERVAGSGGGVIVLKTTEPPFNDVNVRRAMMIGTDMKAIGELQGIGPLPVHWFPVYRGDPTVFTPLEELPTETRLLYDYNPELAKQMLVDAGYPDGFKINLHVESIASIVDKAALVKDMWAKIGVDTEIKVSDSVTQYELLHTWTYKDSIYREFGIANPDALVRRGRTGDPFNHPLWSNERYDELIDKMVTSIDPVEQSRLAKEASLPLLNEVPYIPTNPLAEGYFWWPWMKNFYGEVIVSDTDNVAVLARVWIDQDLKEEMGY